MPSLVSEWMIHGTLYDYTKTFKRASIRTCALVRRPILVSSISMFISPSSYSFAGYRRRIGIFAFQRRDSRGFEKCSPEICYSHDYSNLTPAYSKTS